MSSVYRQSILDVGLRSRSEVDVTETITGVALAGDGDVLLDQREMVLAEGSRETVITYLSDED